MACGLKMFCYQCEQASKGTGCTTIGVCGKTDSVARLQDLLLISIEGLSALIQAGLKSCSDKHSCEKLSMLDRFIFKALFTTITNVNFDEESIIALLMESANLRFSIIEKIGASDSMPSAATFRLASDRDGMIAQAKQMCELQRSCDDVDVISLKDTIVFGLKGVAAYVDHAYILGKTNVEIFDFTRMALAAICEKNLSLDYLVKLALECGRINLLAMELLDSANTEAYGHPTPTQVPIGQRKRKAIMISGHDLKDLHDILEQLDGKNIDVYTHGEMLPCHGYPKLKKYENLYGHYGTAWQNQHAEFEKFPGPILMTTNCIQEPRDSYVDRIFTTGLVRWPNVEHIGEDKDFSKVIECAEACEGFLSDRDNGSVTVGFAHNAVSSSLDKILDCVKRGKIKHFFLVGGCDGAKAGRNYYTEFVERAPRDTVILTLACGKFRFFDKNLGDIEGIPRLIDLGQCNDAYSAVRIALAMAEKLGCSVHDLPLSFILSWYEQKAVAILLTLLHLGIKNIKIGPSLPAFFSPNVLQLLVKTYNISLITTPDNDMSSIIKLK